MANLALTKQNLEQERGIVMEERRLRIDDQVGGVMSEELYLHAFEQSPYRWNTIGFMSDIRRITVDEARAYFETYYAPNNATLVMAGDLDPRAALALVRRYFGGIRRRPAPAPVDASEPPQDGELRKAKNKLRAELVRNLKTVNGRASQLGFFETVLGDYRAMFGLEAAWEKVGVEDVKRVAAGYLQPAKRTVVVLEPIPSGRPAKDVPPRPGGVS